MKSYSKKKLTFYLWAVAQSIFPLLSQWVCRKLCPKELYVLHQRSKNIGLLWKWWSLQYYTFSEMKNIKETIENLRQTVNLPSKYCSLTSVLKGLMAIFFYIYIHSPHQHVYIYQRNKIPSKNLGLLLPTTDFRSKHKTEWPLFFSWFNLEKIQKVSKDSESAEKHQILVILLLWITHAVTDICSRSKCLNRI